MIAASTANLLDSWWFTGVGGLRVQDALGLRAPTRTAVAWFRPSPLQGHAAAVVFASARFAVFVFVAEIGNGPGVGGAPGPGVRCSPARIRAFRRRQLSNRAAVIMPARATAKAAASAISSRRPVLAEPARLGLDLVRCAACGIGLRSTLHAFAVARGPLAISPLRSARVGATRAADARTCRATRAADARTCRATRAADARTCRATRAADA